MMEQLELNFREYFDSSFLLSCETVNLITQPVSAAVSFTDTKSGKIGKLDWTDGVFRFEGAAEESALIFFTHMLQNVNHQAKIYKDVLEKYRNIVDKNGNYSADSILK